MPYIHWTHLDTYLSLCTSGHLSVATHTSRAEMLETDQVGPNLPFRVLSPVASQSPPAFWDEIRQIRADASTRYMWEYIYNIVARHCVHTQIYIYIHFVYTQIYIYIFTVNARDCEHVCVLWNWCIQISINRWIAPETSQEASIFFETARVKDLALKVEGGKGVAASSSLPQMDISR